MGVASIFVSFSVREDPEANAFVRLLLKRLQEQPRVDVWIYESPQGRIASGESIADECRRRIEGCAVFVLLLTDRALESDYVGMEVSHALWVRGARPIKIYPLLATEARRDEWLPQFREAVGYIGRKTTLRTTEVETIVWDLCSSLGTTFVPATDGDRRLPLRSRIIRELEATHNVQSLGIGDFDRLLTRCDHAASSFATGDVAKAKRLAESLLVDFELDHSGLRPYYLTIFRAVCLLSMANDGQVAYQVAHDAFNDIIHKGHPGLDANAFAGRGHASLPMGRHLEALADYACAERLLDRLDPALLYSQIRASILSRTVIDRARIAQLESTLSVGVVGQQIGDASKIAAVLALAKAYAGDLSGVQRAWEFVVEPKDTDAEVVCELSHWLPQRVPRNQVELAYKLGHDILQERLVAAEAADGAVPRDSLHLAQQLARVEAAMGFINSARRRIDKLLLAYPQHVLLLVDAAMLAVEAQEHSDASCRCEQAVAVTNHELCEPTMDRVSFERALAQAYWLLGRRAEARECFRRSGLPDEERLEVTMPNTLGAANPWTAGPSH